MGNYLMPKFKGGVYEDDQGYLRISAGPHRGKRVHILVMEGVLGRKLEPWEDVHHLDENKLNPEWTNLELLSHGDHSKETRRLNALLRRKDKEALKHYEEQDEGSAGRVPKGASVSFP